MNINTDNKVLKTAKYDFSGYEPGDLSFKQGDNIEILLDFQNIDTLYHSDELNWLIGVQELMMRATELDLYLITMLSKCNYILYLFGTVSLFFVFLLFNLVACFDFVGTY